MSWDWKRWAVLLVWAGFFAVFMPEELQNNGWHSTGTRLAGATLTSLIYSGMIALFASVVLRTMVR